ncbi:MAG: TetR/AcrR family transcriptional regulator [Phototrophicaceae bacterium]
MEKPLDRRVKRTRVRLRDSLIKLILEKGYDNVTIQEITDTADLSRATFYLHYKDKDELLANSLEEMFDELMDSVKDLMLRRKLEMLDGDAPSLPAFKHVEEYADLYRSLLGEKGVSSVINRILDYIANIGEQQYHLIIGDEDESKLPVPIDVASRHLAGALFSMVSWWLDNDMPYTPEEMAQYFHRLTIPSIMSAVGRFPHKEEA